MTTMTAKYAGYCTACVGPIRVGAQIDYAPTTKARHIDCANRAPVPGRVAPVAPAPKKASSRKPSAPRAPAYPVSAPAPGAVTIGGRRDGRSDMRYSVGDVVVYDVRAGAKYGVVLARVMVAPNEDMGHYSWTESAWVRPATETEAAPVRARRAAAESAKLAPKLLAQLVRTEGHSVPEEQATLETVAPRAEVTG